MRPPPFDPALPPLSGVDLGPAPWGAPLPWRQPAAPTFWHLYGRHALLLLLTAASIFTCAGVGWESGPGGGRLVWHWAEGLKLVAGVLSILLAHEMGHYVACRIHGVDATLPFFIPAPFINPLVGTLGAVIRIKSPFPHRRALFDIGIAGPLAGFVVCLPVLWLGVAEAGVAPPEALRDGGLLLGEPLLFRWAAAWLQPDVPPQSTLLLGSLGMAAWFGLLITALNLIPIGQLDGGHVTYALFGQRAQRLSRAVWWTCIAMLLVFGPGFVVWTVLVRLLGLRHPRTLDDSVPLGPGRVALAVLGLAVFVVCFLPNPVGLTWGELGQALRGLAELALGLL